MSLTKENKETIRLSAVAWAYNKAEEAAKKGVWQGNKMETWYEAAAVAVILNMFATGKTKKAAAKLLEEVAKKFAEKADWWNSQPVLRNAEITRGIGFEYDAQFVKQCIAAITCNGVGKDKS